MPFYVPVGPRGILFRLGMIWTGVMGSLTYWWTNHRGPVIPVPRSLPHAIPAGQASMIAWPAAVVPLEWERVSHFSGIQAMNRDATGDEFERVRRACVDLGADEEMTELVLDRTAMIGPSSTSWWPTVTTCAITCGTSWESGRRSSTKTRSCCRTDLRAAVVVSRACYTAWTIKLQQDKIRAEDT